MDTLIAIFLIAMVIGVYWIPSLVAFDRDVANKWSVAVLNLFLGWTVLGWVIALMMAVRDKTAKQPAAN